MGDLLTQFAMGAAVIVGFVNGIRLLQETNKFGFVLWCVAVVAGVVLGFLHWYGLTPEVGLAVALGSSGLYRLTEKVSGK